MDIGAIVSERLSAVRKLQENPNDLSAKMVLDNAQKQVCNTFEDEQLAVKLGSNEQKTSLYLCLWRLV